MLVFCTHNVLIQNNNIDNTMVYNLSSLKEGYERLNILPPFKMKYDSKDFDIAYYKYIIENNGPFYDFMKVVMGLYEGKDIIILIGVGEVFDSIAESLQKMIQQRYGVVSYNAYCREDLEEIHDSSSFSIQGLYNLDGDKERYSELLLQTVGKEELEKMEV